MPADPTPSDHPVPGELTSSLPETLRSPDPTSPYPFLAAPQAPDELGQLGPYRVLQLLGAGGMGLVFAAEDRQLKRRVALKVMKPHLAADADARHRFLREAQAAAAVEHDHVVAIYQVGEDRGVPFLAMPLLQGEALEARLRREGRLPVPEVLRIGREIADGLAAAHDRGLIHRDIKPANLWLEAGKQRVKILDFGLARAVADRTHLTQPGTLVGSPQYMSPEQARGERGDPRSDLFSLGCVLYRLCTGEPPFKGSDVLSVLSALALHQPEPPTASAPGTPHDLSDLVMRLLAKDPSARPASARSVAEEVRGMERERGDAPAPYPSPLPLPRPAPGAAGEAGTPSQRVIDSLAVLPLANVGGDPDTEYLSEGISESLITILSQLPRLRVLARSTVFHYKGPATDAREIGRALGVRAVLTGRLLQRGGRLIIKVELVDAGDGAQLWGGHFDRGFADILTLEGTLSREIAEALRFRLTGEDRRRLAKRPTENAEAYRLYLQGRYHWNKRSEDGLRKSIKLFEGAIDLDPTYAPAYAGIADAYLNLGGWGRLPFREAYPRAKAAATQALEIDEGLAEAHVSLAMVLKEFDWDWPGACREYERALELNPNYAVAHQWFGEYLAAIGRHQEAIAAFQRAIELDPLSLIMHATLARHGYYFAREYDRAIAQFHKTLDMDEHFWVARFWLGWTYAATGRLPEAIAELQTARRLDDNLEIVAALGYAYGRAGRRAEAQQALDELRHVSRTRYVSPMLGALIAIGTGETDQALDCLEQGYADRAQMMTELRAEPAFDPLRANPRFVALVRRVGLEAAEPTAAPERAGG